MIWMTIKANVLKWWIISSRYPYPHMNHVTIFTLKMLQLSSEFVPNSKDPLPPSPVWTSLNMLFMSILYDPHHHENARRDRSTYSFLVGLLSASFPFPDMALELGCLADSGRAMHLHLKASSNLQVCNTTEFPHLLLRSFLFNSFQSKFLLIPVLPLLHNNVVAQIFSCLKFTHKKN